MGCSLSQLIQPQPHLHGEVSPIEEVNMRPGPTMAVRLGECRRLAGADELEHGEKSPALEFLLLLVGLLLECFCRCRSKQAFLTQEDSSSLLVNV